MNYSQDGPGYCAAPFSNYNAADHGIITSVLSKTKPDILSDKEAFDGGFDRMLWKNVENSQWPSPSFAPDIHADVQTDVNADVKSLTERRMSLELEQLQSKIVQLQRQLQTANGSEVRRSRVQGIGGVEIGNYQTQSGGSQGGYFLSPRYSE